MINNAIGWTRIAKQGLQTAVHFYTCIENTITPPICCYINPDHASAAPLANGTCSSGMIIIMTNINVGREELQMTRENDDIVYCHHRDRHNT